MKLFFYIFIYLLKTSLWLTRFTILYKLSCFRVLFFNSSYKNIYYTNFSGIWACKNIRYMYTFRAFMSNTIGKYSKFDLIISFCI